MGRTFSLDELAREVGGRIVGDGKIRLSRVAPLDKAREGDLTFLTNPRYAKAVPASGASAVLCEKELEGTGKSFLLSKNPYATLARIIGLFHPPDLPQAGIQPGAWVDPQATVDPTASIAPGASVRAGAKIGEGSVLFPGAYVGERARVGKECLLYPNTTLREDCVLGDRVILQPGAVIGSDGFGFAREGDHYLKIPQVGNVVLEDDVEIGANTCVDRAVLGTTLIGKGTKLDNLIQIGHNVVLGKNVVMAALSGISGSSQVGDNVVMGGQVGLAGHLRIGDDVTLATRTGVMEDILEKGVYWGSPSAAMAVEMKNVAAYRQLPEILKRLRALEKALEQLKE